jgi:hypothetical protein
MSIDDTLEGFFKPEVRASGAKLVAQEKVSVSSGSDTGIQAYVRVAPPVRVRLSAEDISSEAFTADCSCPAGRKAQFCKHVWAVLVCVEQDYPDFLSSKQSIQKPGAEPPEAEVRTETGSETGAEPESQPKPDYQAAAKARAAEYRKQQYQRMKQRAKELKRGRRSREPEPAEATGEFPPPVEAALAYFALNGFEMPSGPSAEVLGEAKKKLSRVFHPDKGGSHDEIIELNENCNLLLRFLKGESVGFDPVRGQGRIPG